MSDDSDGEELEYLTISRADGARGYSIVIPNPDGTPMDCTGKTLIFAMRDTPASPDPPKLTFSMHAPAVGGSNMTWFDRAGGQATLDIFAADVADITKFPLSTKPPYLREYFCAVRLVFESDGSPALEDQIRFRAAIEEREVR